MARDANIFPNLLRERRLSGLSRPSEHLDEPATLPHASQSSGKEIPVKRLHFTQYIE